MNWQVRDSLALAFSAVLHAIAGWAYSVPPEATPARPAGAPSPAHEISIELPSVALPALEPARRLRPAARIEVVGRRRPALASGARLALPDADEGGRGGERTAPECPLDLADTVDHFTRVRGAKNHLKQNQVQRRKTAPVRQTVADRHGLPDPMELTFWSDYEGALHQPPAASSGDAIPGQERAADFDKAGRAGTDVAPSASEDRSLPEQRNAAKLDLGSVPGRESVHALPARRSVVRLSRPNAVQARVSAPALRDGPASDTRDSQDLVNDAVRALMLASTAALERGAGPGGERGGTDSGVGGAGRAKARSRAVGALPGRDAVGDDPGLVGYFRALRRGVDWRDAFPEWAIAEGRGGLVIVDVTLQRSGGVQSVTVSRPSGIAEYDRNIVGAIRRGRFPPFPDTLDGSELVVRMSFDATNPSVGRAGPGPGGRTPAVP